MGIVFDMTITFGNVLTIIASLLSVFAMTWRLSDRLARLETKVDALWTRAEQRRRSD